jgi:hypothetical protein
MATSFVFFIGDLYNPFFCSTLSEFENFLLCERILINVQLVKTKRQANFTDFKRFGALKGLVEQKKLVFCPTGFRIPGYLVTNIKITIYSPLYSSRSLFFLSSSLFFHPSPCRLPSIFLPIPFLSLISPHVFDLLTVLASAPAPSLSLLFPSHSCSLSPRPHFCNPLSFSSLTHTLPPPYCTSILLFSLFSLTYLCLYPYTFLFTFSLYIFSPGRRLILSFF